MEEQAKWLFTPGAKRLLDWKMDPSAASHGKWGVNNWLQTAMELYAPMAERLSPGLQAQLLRRKVKEQIANGELGDNLAPDEVEKRAIAYASLSGKTTISEADVVSVLLQAAGYEVAPGKPLQLKHGGSAPESAKKGEAPASRVSLKTPTLERFGKNLTKLASDGGLLPLIGREEELEVVIETLCRRTKRNPVLVGPAGVGKTAIVEGLAIKVSRGEVPAFLQDMTLFALQPSTLTAGASHVGELESRMQSILEEAGQKGVVLFIDEFHSVVGSGGNPGANDIASLLKPALARGQISCIAATTDAEYRRFIEPDAALERRFQPVRVQEMTPQQTALVLCSLRDDLGKERGVEVPDEALEILIDFSNKYMRNRFFPDKAVDLLEQCVAHAVAKGKTGLTLEEVRDVAQKMVGVPSDWDLRLADLRERLTKSDLLSPSSIDRIVKRLQLSVRSIDLSPTRPNLVLMLAGAAAKRSDAIARILASAIFHSPGQIVTIDCSRLQKAEDITMLLGAPPAYIGHGQTLSIHRLLQNPWCVLALENVEYCHPSIVQVLAQGLADGYLVDAQDRRIYLSESVVLLSAAIDLPETVHVGFLKDDQPLENDGSAFLTEALGRALMEQLDLLVMETGKAVEEKVVLDRYEQTLQRLRNEYELRGLHLEWDADLKDWLAKTSSNDRLWPRILEEEIGNLLLPVLGGREKEVKAVIRVEQEQLRISITPIERRNQLGVSE